MMRLFAECASTLVVEAESAAKSGAVLDMEEKFCSLSLDIIGQAVFNFEFDSVTEESPVIKAVYRVLREAEHRSSSFIPYWKVGVGANTAVTRVSFRLLVTDLGQEVGVLREGRSEVLIVICSPEDQEGDVDFSSVLYNANFSRAEGCRAS